MAAQGFAQMFRPDFVQARQNLRQRTELTQQFRRRLTANPGHARYTVHAIAGHGQPIHHLFWRHAQTLRNLARSTAHAAFDRGHRHDLSRDKLEQILVARGDQGLVGFLRAMRHQTGQHIVSFLALHANAANFGPIEVFVQQG